MVRRKVEKMEKTYFDCLREIKEKNSKVYIYGAGKVGRIIHTYCKSMGIRVEAFCVTNIEQNLSNVDGLQVVKFGKTIEKNSVILIGVVEHGKKTIKEYIQEMGAYEVIDCPEGILYTDEFYHCKQQNPTMEITPAIGCSVNCKFCPQKLFLNEYYRENKDRKSHMSLDEFKIYLNKIPKNTLIEWAGFVEPFLNEESIDMMEYANEHGFVMTLFTTLVGLTEQGLERVLKIPFRQVVLHTADKDGYAHIPVTDEYLHLLKRVVESTKEDGTPFVDSANCQSVPHPEVVEITREKLRIYGEMSDRAGNLENADGILSGGDKKGRIYCERAVNINHNVLLPDGTVVLCCNDFGMRHILGNLLEDEYSQLMCSETMHEIKRGMHIDETLPILCRKCMYAKNI